MTDGRVCRCGHPESHHLWQGCHTCYEQGSDGNHQFFKHVDERERYNAAMKERIVSEPTGEGR